MAPLLFFVFRCLTIDILLYLDVCLTSTQMAWDVHVKSVQDRFAVGDLVRRRVARSDKLAATYSLPAYRIISVRRYTKVRRPTGYKIQRVGSGTPEPTLYRAAQLIAAPSPADEVRFTQEGLRADEDAEYVPWRVLETRERRGKTEARVQWAGYPIAQSTWESAAQPAIAALLESAE